MTRSRENSSPGTTPPANTRGQKPGQTIQTTTSRSEDFELLKREHELLKRVAQRAVNVLMDAGRLQLANRLLAAIDGEEYKP